MTELLTGQTVFESGLSTFPSYSNDRNYLTTSKRSSGAEGGSTTWWWGVDFGLAVEVTSMDVDDPVGTEEWRIAFSVTIEHSDDGSAWTSTPYAYSTSLVPTGLSFPEPDMTTRHTYELDTPSTHRYWRIRQTVGAGYHLESGMSEWWIYGGSSEDVADFSGTPLSGNAPLEVEFTDESTGDSITSWDWDFGDGGTSTDQNPTHTYTSPGVYTVTLVVNDGASKTRVGYIVVTSPGAVVEWSDEVIEDITQDLVHCRRQRGAGSLADGGSYTGSAVIRVRNRDNRYNPENTEGPLFGLLRDGARVWIGVNKIDGTIIPDPGKTVKGVFGGRITDVTVIPTPGSEYPAFVEFTCEDPLAWIGRRPINVTASRHRSQRDLRLAILTAASEPSYDLCVEPTTMPLSAAEGLAGNLLDDLNRANGTRHFARPLDNPDDWYEYVTVRRTQKLDGVPDATLSASDDHVTGTSGWKTSSDTVINQQKATVEPVRFTSYQTIVWEAQDVPFPAERRPRIIVDFDEYVDTPIIDMTVDGSVSASLTAFGDSALIELSGSGTVTRLNVQGAIARRSSAETVTIDDEDSQDDPRGVRAGSDLSGDFLGTITSAHGIAAHIVWRYADGKYRPDLVVENWFPEQFDLEPYDLIAFTSTHIGVAARIFEVLGDTLDMNLAASPTAVHHVTTFQLMESRVQEERTWFTLDQSLLDSETDLLAY
jgi:PKD repeat protein